MEIICRSILGIPGLDSEERIQTRNQITLPPLWPSRALASNGYIYIPLGLGRALVMCLNVSALSGQNYGNLELLFEPLPSQDARSGSFRDVCLNLSPQPAKGVW